MYPLGHIGIGSLIAEPFSKKLSWRALALGTLLPDLIDKPVYYGIAWTMGTHGVANGLISGTRTFGHTGLLILVIWAMGQLPRFRRAGSWPVAIALGMATHLILDAVIDVSLRPLRTGLDPEVLEALEKSPPFLNAVLFPFLGFEFPYFPWKGVSDHLAIFHRWPALIAEVIGAGLIWRKYSQWSSKRSKAVR